MPVIDSTNQERSLTLAPMVEPAWFRCRPFALAGRRVEVTSPLSGVGERFDQLFAAMPDASPVDVGDASPPAPWDVRVNASVVDPGSAIDGGPDRFELWTDGHLQTSSPHLWRCEDELLGLANRQALDDDPGRPHLHSGLVAYGPRGALIVGTTGSGKSTLVAWLVRAGWRYFSDETVPVEAGGELSAYPRPLTLKRGSWPLFADLPSIAAATNGRSASASSGAAVDRRRAHVPLGELGPIESVDRVRPAVIVFVSHGTATTRLTPISAREALVRMIPEVLDLARSGEAGMQRLVHLACEAPAALLEVADLASAAELLRDAVLAPSTERVTTEMISRRGAGEGQPLAGDLVDGSARVVLSAGCRAWSLGDGGVLYDLDRGTVVQLDAAGMGIVRRLDGTRSLDAIADEIGRGDEPDDVVDLARALAGIGVLEADRPDPSPAATNPPRTR